MYSFFYFHIQDTYLQKELLYFHSWHSSVTCWTSGVYYGHRTDMPNKMISCDVIIKQQSLNTNKVCLTTDHCWWFTYKYISSHNLINKRTIPSKRQVIKLAKEHTSNFLKMKPPSSKIVSKRLKNEPNITRIKSNNLVFINLENVRTLKSGDYVKII